jgi:hypothetical protein
MKMESKNKGIVKKATKMSKRDKKRKEKLWKELNCKIWLFI